MADTPAAGTTARSDATKPDAARSDTTKSDPPAPKVTPLDGKAKLDATFGAIETAVFTHHAVEHIAQSVAEALARGPAPSIGQPPSYVLARESDAQVLFAYRAFELQLQSLRSGLEALRVALARPLVRSVSPERDGVTARDPTPPPPPGAAKLATPLDAVLAPVRAATTIVGTVLDLVALFRTDVELSGREVKIDETLFVSELRARLPDAVRLYLPALVPAGLRRGADGHLDVVGGIGRELTELRRLEAEVDARLQKEDEATHAAAIASLKALRQQRQALEAALFGAPFGVSPAPDSAEATPATGTTAATATKTSSATPSTAAVLPTLARGAALDALVAAGAYLLVVRILASGGSMRNEQNRWWGRPRISANGGAVITVLVFDGDGALRMGRTLSALEPYRLLATEETWRGAVRPGAFVPTHAARVVRTGSTE